MEGDSARAASSLTRGDAADLVKLAADAVLENVLVDLVSSCCLGFGALDLVTLLAVESSSEPLVAPVSFTLDLVTLFSLSDSSLLRTFVLVDLLGSSASLTTSSAAALVQVSLLDSSTGSGSCPT